MKIIAKTKDTYLVEMTAREIAHSAGFSAEYNIKGWEKTGYYSYEGGFQIGTIINVCGVKDQ